MSKSASELEFTYLHAIVRIDYPRNSDHIKLLLEGFSQENLDLFGSYYVKVKHVYKDESQALSEARRLNEINSEKEVRYFVQRVKFTDVISCPEQDLS